MVEFEEMLAELYEDPEEIICPDCGGTGSHPYLNKFCALCGGTGVIGPNTSREFIEDE